MTSFPNPEYFKAGVIDDTANYDSPLFVKTADTRPYWVKSLFEIGDMAKGWSESGDPSKVECAEELLKKICSIPLP